MYQLGFVALVAAVIFLGWALRGKPPPPTSVDPAVIAAFSKMYRQQLLIGVLMAPFWSGCSTRHPAEGTFTGHCCWLRGFPLFGCACTLIDTGVVRSAAPISAETPRTTGSVRNAERLCASHVNRNAMQERIGFTYSH